MIKRNNDWGDNETLYGDWRTDTTEEFVLFSYKMYDNGGTLNNYIIMTDTISFEYVNQSNLLTSQIINNQPTTQISIEFNKLK